MSRRIEFCKLSSLVTLENGSRPKGGVGQIAEGVPSVGGEHISRSGGFDFTEIRFVPRDFYYSMKRGKLKIGDVLLVKDGATTGKVALVGDNFPFKEAAVNEHVFIIRSLNDRILPEYLFFLIYSPLGQVQIRSSFHGAAQGGINSEFADDFIVPLPPIEVQEKTATILNKAHMLKGKREEANRLTGKIVQSVFLKMFGDPVKNLETMPTSSLEEICMKVTDGTHDTPAYVNREIGIPLVMAKNVRSDGLDLSDVHFISKSDHETIIKRSKPQKGDVLYTHIGANRGIAAEVSTDLEFSIKNVALFQPDRHRISSRYLVSLLNYPTFQCHILSQSRGGAQNFLHLDLLRGLRVPVPPFDLQKKFHAIAGAVEGLIQKQRTASLGIDELFLALMQKVFKGELASGQIEN